MGETLQRISGVQVKPTGEKRYCRHCRCEQPTLKAMVRIMGVDRANIFCSVCKRYVGGYKILREAKPKAVQITA